MKKLIILCCALLTTNCQAQSLSYRSALGTNVNLTTKGDYFQGPAVAQGQIGTWCAMGSITVADEAGAAQFFAQLWDGKTIIARGASQTTGANGVTTISLSGCIEDPTGDIRILGLDNTSGSGLIIGNSVPLSVLTVWRLH